MTAFPVPAKLYLGTITTTSGTGGTLVGDFGDGGFRRETIRTRVLTAKSLARRPMPPVIMDAEDDFVIQLRMQQDTGRARLYDIFRESATALYSDQNNFPVIPGSTRLLVVPWESSSESYFFAPIVTWSPRNAFTPTQWYEDRAKYDGAELRLLCAAQADGSRAWAEGTTAKLVTAFSSILSS